MKVYSDVLSTQDLYQAASTARVNIAVMEPMERPRKRRAGWIVSLSGSSPYVSQMTSGGHQAATWDEHGLWMAELYRRDPEALISWYKTFEDFLEQTRETRDACQREPYYQTTPQGRRAAKMHRAPWLKADGSFRATPYDFAR